MSSTGDHVEFGGAPLEQPSFGALSPRQWELEQVVKAVRDSSEPSPVYWVMNALATVIACYGLLANSPAVVIGAMVVAMLLGPISGVALGLNERDRPLLTTALRTLAGGVALVLAVATFIGLIHHNAPLTPEMLSRTDARLFDLIIALAGGAAGAVAVLSPRVGTAIVGVAVATALVPPLAAAGILIARADLELAGGALLLALSNVVAIQVAFSAVFWVAGYRRLTALGGKGLLAFISQDWLGLSLVGLLAVVFGIQLHSAVRQSLFESSVRAALNHRFDNTLGSHLVEVRFARSNGSIDVDAVVRGPTAPSAEEVQAAQLSLPQTPIGKEPNLRVRFVETVIMTPHGKIADDDGAEK